MSNPAEVAKTRMQLQGELAKKGGEKVYKNALDVIAKTWRNEGIRGVQRGLGPAVREHQLLDFLLPKLILRTCKVCLSSESYRNDPVNTT